MKDAVIVSACRTAIGSFGGSLRDSHASTIASVTMKEAVQRAGIDQRVSMMSATAAAWNLWMHSM